MQYARYSTDNFIYEASQFAALPLHDIEIKRQNLACVECNEFAWFRKASTHGRPAHFCAHHADTCSLKVEYVVADEPRDASTIAEQEARNGNLIVVRLDQERGNHIDVTTVQPPPDSSAGEGGRTHVLRGAEREFAQHATLRKILLRLVQSPTFRHSTQEAVLYKNEEEILISGAIWGITANFEEISRELHNEQILLYWGPIASAGRTSDGKIWLNSSDRYQGVSVAIFENVVEDFLRAFDISDLDDLFGAHVLVAGRCTFASTGKPVIWCASPKYIVIRRYKDERLQAEL